MTDPLTFKDLAGPNREPDEDERRWLDEHVLPIDPTQFVVGLPGASGLADDDDVLRLVERAPDGSYRAGRFVGELNIAGRPLRIEPRLGFPTLADWLANALNVPVLPRTAGLRGNSAVIPQLLGLIWSSLLAGASRHARPAFRVERRTADAHVRGRIDVRETMRLRARGDLERAVSVERPKSLDHDLSRVLVRADETLDRALRGIQTDWRPPRVRDLVGELRAAVGPHPPLPSLRHLDRIRYTPITVGYRRAAALSHAIARGQGLISTSDDDRASGALIDVAEVWELFLVECAKRAFGAANVEHAARTPDQRHLLRSTRTGRSLGRIKPDIVVNHRADNTSLVLDAKYKRLIANAYRPDGIDRSDLYQLASYLAAADPGTLGALLYPSDDLPAAPAEAEGPWMTTSGAILRFERMPTTRDGVVDALKSLSDAESRAAAPSLASRWAFGTPELSGLL